MELLSAGMLPQVRYPIMPVTCLNAVLASFGGVGRYSAFSGILRTFCGLPRTAGGWPRSPNPEPLDRTPGEPDHE